MRVSNKPTYSLSEMKRLVGEGSFQQTVRVTKTIAAHYDMNPRKVTATVFADLTDLDFVKSVELNNRPGTMADIYVGSDFDDVEWYVKAFIEEERLIVQVWTMWWDGSTH